MTWGMVRQEQLDHDLIDAIHAFDSREAESLLRLGADANARSGTPDTRTFLQRVLDALRGQRERSIDGRPALVEAVSGNMDRNPFQADPQSANRARIVMALLNHGANIDAQDSGGKTALMEAATLHRLPALRLLLDRGANASLRDDAFDMPEARRGHVRVGGTTALQGVMRDVSTAGRDMETPKLLIQNGADIDVRDSDGLTLLMECAPSGDTEGARFLLENGASVNARDSSGRTALMLAVGRTEIIHLLLSHGADINACDNAGRTALMYALEFYSSDDLESVTMLLAHRADPKIRNKSGQTALSIAEKHGYAESVRLLKAAGATK